jgi:ATP-dependent 26S proteasome regulatory subunit
MDLQQNETDSDCHEIEIDTMSGAVFDNVSTYISKHCSCKKRKRLSGYEYNSKKDSGSKVNLTYSMASNVPYSVRVEGDIVVATIENIDNVVGTYTSVKVMKKMTLKSKYKSTIDKLISRAIEESQVVAVQENRDFINIYVYDETEWEFNTSQKKRSLDTIYLSEMHKNKLVDDVEKFMNAERIYQQFCVPYKRNYLLEGPPGTGKTSIIFAIASHYDLNIGVFKPSTRRKTFEEAYKSLPPGTILLIEDIEHCLNLDGKGEKKFSMNDLLNVLDGVMVKQRLLTFITTNHMELLPKVMIRPGRIDVIVNFTFADKEQIIMIHQKFCLGEDSEKFYREVKHLKLTPAILQKFLFRQNFSDRKIEDLEKSIEETSENESYKINYL